jgi:hypothetical protein
MTLPRSALERRIVVALESSPPRVLVVVGGCGSGRTTLLHTLERHAALAPCQYIDVERSVTTPERFLRAVTGSTPFSWKDAERAPASPREAFDAVLAFFTSATGPRGEAVTFLFDEVLDIRTFESFPGLRHATADLLRALATSRNRFVLATRYTTRARRLQSGDAAVALVLPIPPLNAEEVREALETEAALPGARRPDQRADRVELAPIIHALSDGRPVYLHAIFDEMAAMEEHGGSDPLSALTALFAPPGRLAARCGRSYELRLHQARGYGALKAILEILAHEQPLTLTEISQRLHRTPGSTKDYLSWLEDVDLVSMERKRYSFEDPLLRLWVRLYCRPVPPSDEDVAGEVQCYAVSRLPQPLAPEPAVAAPRPVTVAPRAAEEHRRMETGAKV